MFSRRTNEKTDKQDKKRDNYHKKAQVKRRVIVDDTLRAHPPLHKSSTIMKYLVHGQTGTTIINCHKKFEPDSILMFTSSDVLYLTLLCQSLSSTITHLEHDVQSEWLLMMATDSWWSNKSVFQLSSSIMHRPVLLVFFYYSSLVRDMDKN